jgi:nuclear RNA export factor
LKKKFPNLVKLDGQDLGPSISFDVVTPKTALPAWKKLFFSHSSGQNIAEQFIQEYFTMYDSDDRQQLVQAYHKNALFSLTATNNQYATYKEK